MERLREISDRWLEHGAHRERTFTLGQFDEAYLRSTAGLAAYDPTGKIQAFVNLLPSYRSTDGTFDLMRRDPSGPNAVMDLLFVSMIEHFRSAGSSGLNLGLAPFANIDGDTLADRALRVIYERGGRAFNYGGLRAYKNKWRPRWEPRYLAYRGDVELASVAIATGRAGELPRPDTSRLETATGVFGRISRGLISAGSRLPFTSAIVTAVMGVMGISQVDKDSFGRVRAALAYNWADLFGRFQFQRLITATFVQDHAGIRPSIVGLLALLGLTEWILGTKRLAFIFFVGDIASSVATLAAVRVAELLGSGNVRDLLTTRDGGTSSAMFAALVAAAIAIRAPRRRRAAIGGLVVFLVGAVLMFHRFFDVQHLVAGMTGAGLIVGLRRMDLRQVTDTPRRPDAARAPVRASM